MASYHRDHFTDPLHLLLKSQYGRKSTQTCDICQFNLAGLAGYRCDDCDIHIHKACADYFEEFVSFFAHRHILELIRIPRAGHRCDLCREDCAEESFVYRCDECDFDLHPLCSMLPQTVRSPLHPGHDLCMVSSSSGRRCSACLQRLPKWHYVCSCSFKLHISCATEDAPTGAGQASPIRSNGRAMQGSHGPAMRKTNGRAIQGGGRAGHTYGVVIPAAIQGYYPTTIQSYGPAIQAQGYYPAIQGYGPPVQALGNYPGINYGATGSGQSIVASNKPSRCRAIAKFLLKTGFHIAINAATGGLGSPLVEVLSAAMNN
ncbi:hypothetical protein BAE44_0007897 [Dichanthelium oligosanthes]|uniref:Phorbol-ester/DAG-type domain-containing protein n=1 Tax=Dichanthelium oligosanthes TaxID=888268 RepID=A0A1E5W108_9POAL|nr:hypothetical protein BAE44_0007897 [Dichanthelium oligosanthes]